MSEGARHRRRRLHRLEPRARAARARRRGARARQLLDRQPREPRRRRRRGRRGRAAQLRARPQRGARDRGRLPPRRARLGAALGAGPADLERRQRRGHAERAARRARRGRPARRLLVELVGLRHEPRAAGDRGDAARPDLAVRRREARGRALLRQLQPRLRVVRDGRAALLQRLRPAAEPVLAVRGGGAALRHRDRRAASRSRSTATASSRATSPTSRTWSTRRSARPTWPARTAAIFNIAAGAPAT